jgi:anaerobic magnesium-protoporphyrin IX monomethyl ester cyclase
MLKAEAPSIVIVYGGVFPTYHWREVLAGNGRLRCRRARRGGGTMVALASAMADASPLHRSTASPFATAAATRSRQSRPAPSQDLDDYRVGWELIDHSRYSYWGGKRAVVMQFSRGCPHLCNYCGQRGFWTRWRHRDPALFAK